MLLIIKYYITAKEPLLVMLLSILIGVLSTFVFETKEVASVIALAMIFAYFFIFSKDFFGRKTNAIEADIPIDTKKIWLAKLLSMFFYMTIYALSFIIIELNFDPEYKLHIGTISNQIFSMYFISFFLSRLLMVKEKNFPVLTASAYAVVGLFVYSILLTNLKDIIIGNFGFSEEHLLLILLSVSPLIIITIADYMIAKMNNWRTF